ncbi:hypothetical protein V6N13_044600 [Hibiscus sabdariffa]|uniref:Uncharacterized protein n=1 Tax=Hibiscus sabdariffa TaxID=183260 RepID=A0ABR2RIP0_9ROSI
MEADPHIVSSLASQRKCRKQWKAEACTEVPGFNCYSCKVEFCRLGCQFWPQIFDAISKSRRNGDVPLLVEMTPDIFIRCSYYARMDSTFPLLLIQTRFEYSKAMLNRTEPGLCSMTGLWSALSFLLYWCYVLPVSVHYPKIKLPFTSLAGEDYKWKLRINLLR